MLLLMLHLPQAIYNLQIHVLQLVQTAVACLLNYQLANNYFISTKRKLHYMLFEIHRILGTPTEKTWPGVSQLPDYKTNFPRWSGEGLRKAVPQLDNNGLDLLEVHVYLYCSFQ